MAVAALSHQERILQVVREIPVDHSKIADSDNDSMDRVVAGLPLSDGEFKRHQGQFESNRDYFDTFMTKMSRVIVLSDGTSRIFNLTPRTVGYTCFQQGDRLIIDKTPVNSRIGPLFWSRRKTNDFAVIRDRKDGSVEIDVEEAGQKPSQSVFIVNLSRKVRSRYTHVCHAPGCKYRCVITERVYVASRAG